MKVYFWVHVWMWFWVHMCIWVSVFCVCVVVAVCVVYACMLLCMYACTRFCACVHIMCMFMILRRGKCFIIYIIFLVFFLSEYFLNIFLYSFVMLVNINIIVCYCLPKLYYYHLIIFEEGNSELEWSLVGECDVVVICVNVEHVFILMWYKDY